MNLIYNLVKINTAFAQQPGSVPPNTTQQKIPLYNPLGANGPQNIMQLINKLANLMISVGIALAVIMVLYGAYQMMFSAGDPKKFADGQKTIMYTAIGLAVLVLAKGIVGVVYGILKGI